MGAGLHGGGGHALLLRPDTGTYAALGHAITDGDTGEVLTVDRGQILKADIVSVQKGEKGAPGELKAAFCGKAWCWATSSGTTSWAFTAA